SPTFKDTIDAKQRSKSFILRINEIAEISNIINTLGMINIEDFAAFNHVFQPE
ncbi:4421_t:CDS:2, partial [Dentiscutata erythropus]